MKKNKIFTFGSKPIWLKLIIIALIFNLTLSSHSNKNLPKKHCKKTTTNSFKERPFLVHCLYNQCILAKQIQTPEFNYPFIKYISEWNEYLVLDSNQTFTSYDDYLNQTHYHLEITKDFIRIKNKQSIITNPSIIIEAKIFNMPKNKGVLGINYSYSSFNTELKSAIYFYKFKKSQIESPELNFFTPPIINIYFKSDTDLNLINDYNCFAVGYSFFPESTDLVLSPQNNCEDKCEKEQLQNEKICGEAKKLITQEKRYCYSIKEKYLKPYAGGKGLLDIQIIE